MIKNEFYDERENTFQFSQIDFSKAHKVDISSLIPDAKKWGDKSVEYKRTHQEEHLVNDSFKDYDRRKNGYYGERAVELLIGEKFVDESLGNSKDFKTPDLKPLGLNCGVKTARFGRFPLIKPLERQPQIIVITLEASRVAYIFGVAFLQNISTHTKKELVYDKNALSNGKLGFYGFKELVWFNSFTDLQLTIV
jgi:hypothetical protein